MRMSPDEDQPGRAAARLHRRGFKHASRRANRCSNRTERRRIHDEVLTISAGVKKLMSLRPAALQLYCIHNVTKAFCRRLGNVSVSEITLKHQNVNIRPC